MMVLVGEAGSGMFNHQDTLRTASWQAQIQGSKRWHICSPEQSPYLYDPGDVDTFRPNYVTHPRLRRASCYQDEVR